MTTQSASNIWNGWAWEEREVMSGIWNGNYKQLNSHTITPSEQKNGGLFDNDDAVSSELPADPLTNRSSATEDPLLSFVSLHVEKDHTYGRVTKPEEEEEVSEETEDIISMALRDLGIDLTSDLPPAPVPVLTDSFGLAAPVLSLHMDRQSSSGAESDPKTPEVLPGLEDIGPEWYGQDMLDLLQLVDQMDSIPQGTEESLDAVPLDYESSTVVAPTTVIAPVVEAPGTDLLLPPVVDLGTKVVTRRARKRASAPKNAAAKRKRLASRSEEVTSTNQPASTTPKGRTKMSYRERRDRNNVASKASRQKKKEKDAKERQKTKELEDERTALKQELAEVTAERDALKARLVELIIK